MIASEVDISIKRDGPPPPDSPSSNRPAKRSKQPINESVHLPSETWAAVMNHLDFSSVLSVTATTRTMRDAAPFVTELHVNKSSQMHASVGRRFCNVQTVYIYTLIQLMQDDLYDRDYQDHEDTDTQQVVDFETTARAALFIAPFVNLKKIYFGGISVSNDWLYPIVPYSALNFDVVSVEEQFSRLIDSISAGYRCGALPPSLEVKGLMCPQTFRDEECNVCPRACESFPVTSVAKFDCRENSHELCYSQRTYHACHDLFASCMGRHELVSVYYDYNMSVAGS